MNINRLQLALLLIIVGLVVELASLGGSHYVAFLIWGAIGTPALLIGVALFLWETYKELRRKGAL